MFNLHKKKKKKIITVPEEWGYQEKKFSYFSTKMYKVHFFGKIRNFFLEVPQKYSLVTLYQGNSNEYPRKALLMSTHMMYVSWRNKKNINTLVEIMHLIWSYHDNPCYLKVQVCIPPV